MYYDWETWQTASNCHILQSLPQQQRVAFAKVIPIPRVFTPGDSVKEKYKGWQFHSDLWQLRGVVVASEPLSRLAKDLLDLHSIIISASNPTSFLSLSQVLIPNKYNVPQTSLLLENQT